MAKSVREKFPVVDGIALRLSFTAKAIREHFDDGDPGTLAGLTDRELEQVGAAALACDDLYRAFGGALDEALAEYRDVTP